MRRGSPGAAGDRAIRHEGTRMEGGLRQCKPPRMRGRATRTATLSGASVASTAGDRPRSRRRCSPVTERERPRWSPVGRPRWPGSTRFDGRADLVVAPADGVGAAGRGHRRLPGRAAGACWVGRRRAGRRGRATAACVVLAVAGGRRRACSPATADAVAPAVSARGEVAFAHRARRRVRRRDRCRSTVRSGRERVSHADYAWDPAWSPDGATLAWHEWDLPDMPWDASRIVRPRATTARSRRRRRRRAARAASRGSRPTARSSRTSATRRLAVLGSPTPTARTPAVLAEHHEHAEPAWGPGQRSYAWSPDGARARVVPQRGRVRPARDRRARPQVGARAVARAGTAVSTGATAASSCVRSGAVTPPQVVVLAAERFRPARVRARAGRRVRGDRLVEPQAGDVEVGERDRARTAVAQRRRAVGAAPLIVHVHGGPTGQALADWNPRVQCVRAAGLDGVAAATTAARPATAARTAGARRAVGRARRRRRRGRHPARREGRLGRPAPGRADGRERGRDSPCCSSPRSIPISSRAVVALFPVTDLVDLAATTHRFESGYTVAARRPAARRAARRTSTARRSRARRDPRAGAAAARRPTTTSCRRRSRRRFADALRARGRRRSSATCTRRGPRLAPGRDGRRRARRASTRSSTRWC